MSTSIRSWIRLFFMTSLSSTILWFRSISFIVHRETSIQRQSDDHTVYGIPTTLMDTRILESQTTPPLLPKLNHQHQEDMDVPKATSSKETPVVVVVERGQQLQQKQKMKPHRRTIEKIYYIQTDPSRTAYMERWLSQQSKIPFAAIPVVNKNGQSDTNNNNSNNYRLISQFRQVASFVQQDLSTTMNRTLVGENWSTSANTVVLIVQDNFKIFDQTLGRLERALKWLPDDFDVAQVDCFLTSSPNSVLSETRRDFVEIFQQDSWKGGMHAMIWRSSHLDRIQTFLSNKTTGDKNEDSSSSSLFFLDCSTISPQDLKLYCLHFDNYHRVGCFHHWKASSLPDDSIQRGTSIVFPTSKDCEARLKEFNVPSPLELQLQLPPLPVVVPTPQQEGQDEAKMAYHTSVVNVSGIEYTYRVIMSPSSLGTNFQESVRLSREDAHHPTTNRLLLGICSANTNFAQRQAIRQTWGPLAWRTYFIVAGRDFDDVQAEFDHYQDLIWIDMEEHYKFALTPKTMVLLHFASSFLQEERKDVVFDHLFKTDDDMFVNITQLDLDLSKANKKKNDPTGPGGGTGVVDYFGLPMIGTGPERDSTSKFYLAPDEYGPELFPPYATGGGYALSQRFLQCASQQVGALPRMWWEDVAVGMLAEICGMELTAADWTPEAIKAPGRYFQQNPDTIAIAHRVSIENQFRIHHGFRPVFDDDSFITPRLCPEME